MDAAQMTSSFILRTRNVRFIQTKFNEINLYANMAITMFLSVFI